MTRVRGISHSWIPRRKWRIAVLVASVPLGFVLVLALLTLGPHGNLSCEQIDNPRCREVTGRVLYVEAVDPDGDGDSHLVLVSRQSLTWPGVTIVVIRPPKRLASTPHLGTWVNAIGLPNTGSHGETTLNALQFELH